MSSSKKLEGRAARRAAERAAEKLTRAREQLAKLEPGGTPSHPIEVGSASLVEPRAASMRCLRCENEVRVVDHAAVIVGDARLRLARTACKACGAERAIYFRIGTTLAS